MLTSVWGTHFPGWLLVAEHVGHLDAYPGLGTHFLGCLLVTEQVGH